MRGALALLVALLLTGCTHQEKPLTQKERERAASIGQMAVKRLMGELKTNLGTALKEGGFPKAIEFCAGKAEELTAKVNKELVVVRVKRVSDKYRNPKNRPDKLDLAVIKEFKEKLKEGKLPPYEIKRIKLNGKEYLVYYKPILVAPFCLNCHGEPTRMNPEVLRVIKEKYPQDRALGYRAGQLRGVFKVLIPEEEVKGG
ncbi:Tll0287-like domain-containing protein [Thermovibrio sp.]